MQRQYALDMLSRFGMIGCKPITMPLEVNGKLTQDGGELIDDVTMYRYMVGSLIYMTITRPDLSYAIGLVSQFMQAPRKPHLDSVRRIMRYVKKVLFSMVCFILMVVICICLAIQMLIGLGALMTGDPRVVIPLHW